MPSTLVIGEVVFDDAKGQLPPPPVVTAPLVRATLLEAIATSPEVIIRTGVSTSRPVRIASAENLGFITAAQRDALITLYLAGGTFILKTDLLGVRNAEQTYNGVYFDPSVAPVFTSLPVYTGNHWGYDLLLRVPYA